MCKPVKLTTNYGMDIQVADIKKVFIENNIKTAPECKKYQKLYCLVLL